MLPITSIDFNDKRPYRLCYNICTHIIKPPHPSKTKSLYTVYFKTLHSNLLIHAFTTNDWNWVNFYLDFRRSCSIIISLSLWIRLQIPTRAQMNFIIKHHTKRGESNATIKPTTLERIEKIVRVCIINEGESENNILSSVKFCLYCKLC